MFYKLSNSASLEEVQNAFQKKVAYPSVYDPKVIVDGMTEDNLYILSTADPERFNIAIWGLMPQGFAEEWRTFQNISNTLNVTCEMLNTTPWMREALHTRRCLILATGYFSYRLSDGEVWPYYVSHDAGGPFLLGGITTELADGFRSCALLTVPASTNLRQFHDIDDQMPLVVPPGLTGQWLSEKVGSNWIWNILKHPPETDLSAKPVSRSFFENFLVGSCYNQGDSDEQPTEVEGAA